VIHSRLTVGWNTSHLWTLVKFLLHSSNICRPLEVFILVRCINYMYIYILSREEHDMILIWNNLLTEYMLRMHCLTWSKKAKISQCFSLVTFSPGKSIIYLFWLWLWKKHSIKPYNFVCFFSGCRQFWDLPKCRSFMTISLRISVNLFPFSTVFHQRLLMQTILAPLNWVFW